MDISLTAELEPDYETLRALQARSRWYKNPNSRKIVLMATLSLSFLLAEFVVGILTNSLALLADAFHMMSDQVAFLVGFISIQMASKGKSKSYSYGWVRAEVLGALVNSVFLLSVCLFILLEALQRFSEKPAIVRPVLIVAVAGAGILINIVGLIIFRGHGHHGHSHESHSSSHSSSPEPPKETVHSHSHVGQLNMHALFLHALGDALGSLGALLTGLGIWLLPWDWKFYLDPICSVFIAMIILRTSIPLVKRCLRILMQSVPENLDLCLIESELLKLHGLTNIHEFHVWQLSDTKVIGTVHISCSSNEFHSIAKKMKTILHSYGVHATTIQPEFEDDKRSRSPELRCSLSCETKGCEENLCCQPAADELGGVILEDHNNKNVNLP